MKQTPCNEIAGIILAAGEGKRIGRTKALLKVDKVSFLEKIATCLKAVGCKPILVVGGSDANLVKKEAKRLGIGFAHNASWEDGQFSSLKIGLANLKMDVCGAIVALVDHPFVAKETYENLKKAFQQFPQRIVMPVYEHRRGHPIVIPRAVIRESVEAVANITLKDIISRHEKMIIMHRCADPAVLQDIDTMDDLLRARQQ